MSVQKKYVNFEIISNTVKMSFFDCRTYKCIGKCYAPKKNNVMPLFNSANTYISDSLRETVNPIDSYEVACLSLFCIMCILFSQQELIHNAFLVYDHIVSVTHVFCSRSKGTERTTNKMKINRKCASAHIRVPLIEKKKRELKKRDVDNIKVIIALNTLIGNSGDSILRINDVHSKALAQRFKVSQNVIKSKIADMQPTVAVREM